MNDTPQPIRITHMDSATGERVGGEATFEARLIAVRLADGRRLELPYEGFLVTRGGASGGTTIVTVSTGTESYARLFMEEGSFAGKLGDRLPDAVAQQLRGMSRTSSLRRHPWLWVGGSLIVGTAVIAYATFGAMDALVSLTPAAWEVKLGKAVGAGAIKEPSRDPVITGAVDRMTRRLTAQLPPNQPYPFSFTVVRSDQENAFALPGGQVVLTTALIAKSQSPDEVAGVLGHEIQHVLGRHTLRRVAKELGLGLLVSVALGDASGGAAVMVGKNLAGLAFDRGQESESDRFGVKLAHAAGFEPGAMAEFFKRLQAAEARTEGEERAMALLSTHPAHSDRLAEIARLAAELPDRPRTADALAAEWPEVRRRAAQDL
ncbi:MAG: M48 family metallopeptidase [Candidatus Sericytochromatia bacterium]